MYVSTLSIFGVPAGIAATYIVCFVIFGCFLEQFGAGQWFVDVAFAGTGRFRGGPAKTAIASSALMVISGGNIYVAAVLTAIITIILGCGMFWVVIVGSPFCVGGTEKILSQSKFLAGTGWKILRCHPA